MKKNTEFKLENQKNLNHCNIRNSLNVKKFFRYTCKNQTLKKLKHGEIVKPDFKYIREEMKVKKLGDG